MMKESITVKIQILQDFCKFGFLQKKNLITKIMHAMDVIIY